MSYTTHGTCSRCGGAVCTPTVWMGIYPPVPTCQSCGASPKNAHGPVIDMDVPKVIGRRDRPFCGEKIKLEPGGVHSCAAM